MIHIALFYRDYSWAKLKRGITGFTLICFGLSTTLSAAQAETYYFHTDHLNTPKVLTDSSKQIVWRGVAKPFGETDTVVNTIDNPLRFPGQYFDPETGLHYNYIRDYDPALGRYIQSDPIGLAGGMNTYAYVQGNPFMYTDPTGENAIAIPTLVFLLAMLIACPPGSSCYQNIVDALTAIMEFRSQEVGAEGRPADVNPGEDCDGNCKPCPPNPPPFTHEGDAHGSTGGFHAHQWQYHQAPDCTCRARKESW